MMWSKESGRVPVRGVAQHLRRGVLVAGMTLTLGGCTLYGWGSNSFGSLGDGTHVGQLGIGSFQLNDHLVPTVIGTPGEDGTIPLGGWVSVSAGSGHTEGIRYG